jgi:hypothetical protein
MASWKPATEPAKKRPPKVANATGQTGQIEGAKPAAFLLSGHMSGRLLQK